MKHWFSDMYASVDAMRLDEFVAGLTPDVEVVVGNNPAMKGRQAVKEGIGHFFSTIAGLKHHFVNVVEGNGLTFLEAKVDYLQEGRPAGHRSRGDRAGAQRRAREIAAHLFRRRSGLRLN